MITSTNDTAAAAAAAQTTTIAAEGELRSRGTSRNNLQSGGEDDNNDDAATSCQKRGWFRASRLGILQKYKSRILGGVMLAILITMVVVLLVEMLGTSTPTETADNVVHGRKIMSVDDVFSESLDPIEEYYDTIPMQLPGVYNAEQRT